ncbi:MAG: hypothetical protein M3Z75_06475 [Actinomycetota bacterium]|nr:hypothetical protein [Actinomycetota bacterium]
MAATKQDVTISPRLVTALDRAWAAIQARHADVPAVVITLGSGSGSGSPAGHLKLGHFATGRWQRADTRLSELFVGGEGLASGSREVLGTLLHEAAHGMASVREIQDTSRQGRFHNTRYRALAEELGLTVAKTEPIGWSGTTVPDATAALYRAELRRLDDALVAYRHAERGKAGGGRASNNNGSSARCDCGRRIRVSVSVLSAGPITCGLCGADFEAAEAEPGQ